MVYESKFIHLGFIVQNKDVLKFAKKKAIQNFKFNAQEMVRWTGLLSRRERGTRQDIIISFQEFKAMKELEKNPQLIPKEDGWSTYSAKEFLMSKGLITNYYERNFEEEWMASTHSIKVDDQPFANMISYYVMGDMHKVTELKIRLDVTNSKNKTSAIQKMLICSSKLCQKAIEQDLPKTVFDAIKNGRNISLGVQNKSLQINKEDWLNHRNKAYTITFTIKVKL